MAHKPDDILNNYDVFPKVIAAGKKTEINIRPLGGRQIFEPCREYPIAVCALDGGNPAHFPASGDYRLITASTDENCCFRFEYTFDSEQEYFIRVLKDGNDPGSRLIQFSVYCVEGELARRYPFMGDLHMHTTCSDGSQIPEVVCANYRRYGYDFMVISDHGRYYPSLRAREFYSRVPTELNVVPGEEVHLPRVYGRSNDVHIVNFGGEYSVNALVESTHTQEVGKDPALRAIRTENVPDVMTVEEFSKKMLELAEEIEVPEKVDALPAAMCKWAFGEIRKGGGLAIFPHPNWRPDTYHVPEAFSDWLFESHVFDAFEVLGGESYYEHNGFQTARYYDQWAKGNRYPVVGSTDSHSSYESNRNAFVCETIVFSPENERKAIVQSVKDFFSVAVDTISKEFRLVGEARFVRYGCFLLKNYFPLHDALCEEEGRLMKVAATGTDEEKAEAVELLGVINGRVARQRKKYFDLDI